jgi:hypothetical protein
MSVHAYDYHCQWLLTCVALPAELEALLEGGLHQALALAFVSPRQREEARDINIAHAQQHTGLPRPQSHS